MENLGQKLRAVRESRGMTVSEVAVLTKISVQTIKEIEDNTLDKQYAPIYAKGFIKLYAESVGLSPDELSSCVAQSKQDPDLPGKQELPVEQVPSAVFKQMKSFAFGAAEKFREWRVRVRERMSAASREKDDDVEVSGRPPLKESAKALFARMNVSRRTMQIAGFCVLLMGALIMLVVAAQRMRVGRLMAAAAEVEIVQEPPAPYIE